MTIGDKVIQRPIIGEHRCEPMAGRVVYIHPEGRFYTLEFTFPGIHGTYRFRESFFMNQTLDD